MHSMQSLRRTDQVSRLEMGCHLAGARSIGLCQSSGAGAEQVVRAAHARQQALLGGGVRLDGPVDQNMSERNSAFRQRAGDQQATVTIERLALGAHETQAKAF